MEKAEAVAYLQGLIGRQLRITTSDTRIFMGQMKCTDKDRNVILGYTYEYRHPTSSQVANAAEDSSSSKVKLDMTSRYLGLVVVPGEHIVKMELEKSAKGKAGASGEA